MEGLQLGWISQFVKEAKIIPSPFRFKLWSGLFAVGAALGRRVWTEIEPGEPLYPNLYVMLVAEPAIGKSRAMKPARRLLAKLPNVALSPDEITKERFIQQLGELFFPQLGASETTYAAFVSEWGTFMEAGDKKFMQQLSGLWDCPDIYERETKNAGNDHLEKPVLNMIAGVQPSWFLDGFPPDAFEMGLPTRIMFVWAEAADKPPRVYGKGVPFNGDRLLGGLTSITRRAGLVPMSPPAMAALQRWADDGQPPAIIDPMLRGYAGRRDLTATKLALIVAMARGHSTIEASDLAAGFALMFDMEADMHKAVAAAGGNLYRLREVSVANYVRDRFAATKRFVPEWELRQQMGRQLAMYMLEAVIDGLVDSKQLTVVAGKKPSRMFRPGSREVAGPGTRAPITEGDVSE